MPCLNKAWIAGIISERQPQISDVCL